MSDPKPVQAANRQSQEDLRRMVDREVTDALRGRGPKTLIEEAFVRAVYNPDRRLA